MCPSRIGFGANEERVGESRRLVKKRFNYGHGLVSVTILHHACLLPAACSLKIAAAVPLLRFRKSLRLGRPGCRPRAPRRFPSFVSGFPEFQRLISPSSPFRPCEEWTGLSLLHLVVLSRSFAPRLSLLWGRLSNGLAEFTRSVF